MSAMWFQTVSCDYAECRVILDSAVCFQRVPYDFRKCRVQGSLKCAGGCSSGEVLFRSKHKGWMMMKLDGWASPILMDREPKTLETPLTNHWRWERSWLFCLFRVQQNWKILPTLPLKFLPQHSPVYSFLLQSQVEVVRFYVLTAPLTKRLLSLLSEEVSLKRKRDQQGWYCRHDNRCRCGSVWAALSKVVVSVSLSCTKVWNLGFQWIRVLRRHQILVSTGICRAPRLVARGPSSLRLPAQGQEWNSFRLKCLQCMEVEWKELSQPSEPVKSRWIPRNKKWEQSSFIDLCLAKFLPQS